MNKQVTFALLVFLNIFAAAIYAIRGDVALTMLNLTVAIISAINAAAYRIEDAINQDDEAEEES